MPPDRRRQPSGTADALEVACYTKELGRPLQRQLLRQRLAGLSEGGSPDSGHGDDAGPTPDPRQLPREDRAG